MPACCALAALIYQNACLMRPEYWLTLMYSQAPWEASSKSRNEVRRQCSKCSADAALLLTVLRGLKRVVVVIAVTGSKLPPRFVEALGIFCA